MAQRAQLTGRPGAADLGSEQSLLPVLLFGKMESQVGTGEGTLTNQPLAAFLNSTYPYNYPAKEKDILPQKKQLSLRQVRPSKVTQIVSDQAELKLHL